MTQLCALSVSLTSEDEDAVMQTTGSDYNEDDDVDYEPQEAEQSEHDSDESSPESESSGDSDDDGAITGMKRKASKSKKVSISKTTYLTDG